MTDHTTTDAPPFAGAVDAPRPLRRRTRRRATSPALSPIVATAGISIERQVYGRLRYAIMTGQVLPGSKLTSRSLSEVLGVSAMPVREALKRLEADGAVISRHKSAFILNDPDAQEFAEILDIRLELEGLAVRKAAQKATKDAIAPIKALNDHYADVLHTEPFDMAASLEANFQFHFELYKLAGSATLNRMIEGTWLRIGPALHKYAPAQISDDVLSFHRRVICAVERGDIEEAERGLHDDLKTAAAAIADVLVNQNDTEHPAGRDRAKANS